MAVQKIRPSSKRTLEHTEDSTEPSTRLIKRPKSQQETFLQPQAPPQANTNKILLKGAGTGCVSRNTQSPQADQDGTTLRLIESTGDIFDAPAESLLIHSCNCEGSWGAGIAKAFKDNYPDAFTDYADACIERGHALLGKALLIPPHRKSDPFIGCLFTSRAKGKKKGSPAAILQATGPAMQDLLRQINELSADEVAPSDKHGDAVSRHSKIGEVRMCQINSGLFNVPWLKTKETLQSIEVGEDDRVKEIMVISRPL